MTVPTPAPTARRFSSDRAAMFDLAKTSRLASLFAVAPGSRDESWVDAMFDAAWCASVVLHDPPVFTGPDGFPYLRLDVPRPSTAFDSNAFANLAPTCIERATGVSFFASPDDPLDRVQYVLPVGVIDSLVRYDSWRGDPQDVSERAEPEDASKFATDSQTNQTVLRRDVQAMSGTPSAAYLPPATARALHAFMSTEWQMEDPRVGLMVIPGMRPSRALVLGRARSEFTDARTANTALKRVLWFLPPSRAVMLRPEDSPLETLAPLRDLGWPA